MHPRGFTVIEVILTVAILAIVFTASMYGIRSIERSFASQSADREMTNILTTAARRARMGINGSNWGVYIPYDDNTRTSTTAVVFSGSSYATRVAASDVTYTINNSIKFTSADFSGAAADTGNDHEVVFSSLTGSTSQFGSITMQWYGQSQTVTIDSSGLIVRVAL